MAVGPCRQKTAPGAPQKRYRAERTGNDTCCTNHAMAVGPCRQKNRPGIHSSDDTERRRAETKSSAPSTQWQSAHADKKTAPGIPRTVLQEPYLRIYMGICSWQIPYKSYRNVCRISMKRKDPFGTYLHRASAACAGTEQVQDTLLPHAEKAEMQAWVRERCGVPLCTKRVILCIMGTDTPGGLFWYVRYYNRIFRVFN